MTNETIKPEVGQVWETKAGRQIFHIIKVSKNAVRCFRNGFVLKPETFEKEKFLEKCKYIGKAEGSISDLFEVEDENRI